LFQYSEFPVVIISHSHNLVAAAQMPVGLQSDAIVFEKPGRLSLRTLALTEAQPSDLVIDVQVSGISTGTEKLLWNGTMPVFPGLAYPLVPGYEAVGVVTQRGDDCTLPVGTRVFVPGASCYRDDVRGLFGASASRLVVPESRVTPVGDLLPEQGVLLALAATAMHVITYRLRQDHPGQALQVEQIADQCPQLIIGHGVLGRLLARLCLAVGAPAPMVWEIAESRRLGALGYEVIAPQDDVASPGKHTHNHIVDVSGATGGHFNRLIAQLGRGGRLTLAGFYNEPVAFDFAPAFMREITLGIAAEWAPDDLSLVMTLLNAGALSLDGLVSHEFTVDQAASAYPQAFDDPACLKTILHWSA
jgi:3-hydroxyethyl bacteriochlorophyllide a dehydrogenase